MALPSDPRSGQPAPAIVSTLAGRVGALFSAAVLLAMIVAAGLYWIAMARIDSARPARVDAPAISGFAATLARAEMGDGGAQTELARLYAEGRGTRRDYAASARWFRAAAERGAADAQVGLAELYEAGQGVPLEYSEAAAWYRRAAEQGHAGAQFGLAVLYEFGRGVARDQQIAASWYRRAADQGEPEAEYNLAQRYSTGLGVGADPVQAYKWFRLAGRHGLTDARKAADECGARLTPAQRAEADAAVATFAPGNAPDRKRRDR